MNTNTPRRPRALRLLAAFAVAVALGLSIQLADVSAQSPGQLPVPLPGRNVNMVSGTTHPDGDPFLQRQNEPSIAVSTRNPQHLFGAANDYRTVDIPGLGDEVNGDAWIGVFKSFDGGHTWKSTLLPGYRQDATTIGKTSPLYGLEAGADPVVRAGTNGLFYLAGMAFNRSQDAGRVFLSRYIDNNNLEAGDSIAYLGTTVVDIGNKNRFLDKPWLIVDIPRAMKGDARTAARDNADRTANNGVPKKPTAGPVCVVPGQAQPIPAGNIYVVYSVFVDNDSGDQNKSANGKTSFERELDRLERNEGKERDEHKPGEPVDGRTKIMIARSTDCGATFDAPHQISDRTQINQGATAAIDPNTGTLYVAWREFLSSKQPDSILVAKSTDGGQTFSTPVVVRTISPFDQGTTRTSFRTNSYPTMAVDASGRVYIAWAQRGVGLSGDARIVVSSSTDGKSWSDPVAADNPPQRGHQFMPVLTFGGGRLHLVFWDQRDDMSKMWGYFIDEAPILNYTGPKETRPTRHTLDLRGVSAWPGAPPTWGPSAKVSNYLEGIMPGKTRPQQLQFNAPNLPLFSLGTKPFIGDYLDVTVAPTFIANGDGTWRFNTLTSDPAQYFTAWGDNRDVRPPKDGNWVHYTPPTFAGYTGTSIYDPTQPVEMCKPGQAGMRDQNVYSAKVSSGLLVTTPGNNKRLGYVTDASGVRRLMQRTFVITVANPDKTLVKSIALHITSQPPGGHASFLQFSQLIDLPVDIAPESSISREVFVTSTDPYATVPITITEGSSSEVTARLYLNPDPTNPDIDNPDIDNPDIDNPDIDNAEVHNITVSTPDIDNPDIDNVSTLNPDIDNPDIDNPDIDNTRLINTAILNPDIDNPDIDNPDIDNTNILNPDIDNPDIDNPDIDNGALTDVTWNVSNVGNTATSYQVKLLLKQAQQQRLLNAGVKFQLIVTKTTAAPTIDKCAVVEPNRNLTVVKINSPSFVDPTNAEQLSTIINPDIDNPDIDNATVALAPGDTARVTLRVFSPVGDTAPTEGSGGSGDPLEDLTGALEDLQKVGVATTSHPVDTLDVIAGDTTPTVEASIPLIITERLDDATRAVAYTETIEQTGAVAPFAFSVTTGSLPQGLALNADGTITGTPVVSGAFTFTVKVTDANDNYASVTLTIRVFEPVVVAGGTLTGAGINQPYSATLSAGGGFPPYTWSVAGGALPAGVTLTAGGVLTGTPTQSGTFNFSAMAMDAAVPPKNGFGAFVLNVTAAANPQSVNVIEDTATPITVSGTGTGPFTFNIGNQPAHGTLSGAGPTFTYTPDLNYTGPDSFTFSATQGSLTSAFATVSINVTAVNDAPTATPKTVNTAQGVPIAIVLTGSDPENNPLTFSIVSNPTAGTLSGVAPNVTYNPPQNGFTGTATFTFRVSDGALFSAPATVSVIVGPPPANSADVTLTLADAPDPAALGGSITYTATLHNNGPASATGVALSLAYPSADLQLQSVVPSQGSCAPGNALTCSIGVIANGADATVTLTLKAFNHGGTFTVTGSATGTLLDYNTSNNAASATTTVNGPAVATADLHVSQTAPEGSVAINGTVQYTVSVTNHGPSDATGVSLTNNFTANTAQYVSVLPSQGSCATVGSQITCSVGDLDANFTATYIITFKAIGPGSIANTATVTGSQADSNAGNNTQSLSTPVENRNPTATDDAMSTREDQATTFLVLANDSDPDNDPVSLTIVDQPGHGVTQISGNGIAYTPAADYFGADTFTYQISDGRGGVDSGTVNVTVLAVNDAPSFTAGPNQTATQGSGAHTVPAWASNIAVGPANEAAQTIGFIVENDKHSLFAVQPAVSSNGTLTYTLAASGLGTATVTVSAVDSGGTDNGGLDSSASQAFTITISNQPPQTTDDEVLTLSDLAMQSYPGSNDIDPNQAYPQVRTTYAPFSPAPLLTTPGEVAVMSSTGRAYFSGGNLSSATDGKIGVLNLATSTVDSAIQMKGNVSASLTRVSQGTRIAYLRTGNSLQAIDGRSESPTYHQSILNVNIGSIQSMALDEPHKRLYVTATNGGFGLLQSGHVAVFDIDPSSPTFHQVIADIAAPGAQSGMTAIAVNAVTNKVYIAASSSNTNGTGVYVMDAVTFALTQVAAGTITSANLIAVNDVENVIYAGAGTNLHVIDGVTDTRIATITMPASISGSPGSDRIAIHRGNGKVFVRTSEFPNPSRLLVYDGTRVNPTFNSLLATLVLGRDNGNTAVVVDEGANRLVTTSNTDLETSIVNTTTLAVTTIKSMQTPVRATIDTQTHRAYVTGGIGFIQVLDLAAAGVHATVPVGIELFGLDANPVSHTAYVGQTGLTTGVVRLNDTGLVGAVPLPNGAGREEYVMRNAVTNTIYAVNGGANSAGTTDALPGYVHVINANTNTVTASVEVGPFPFGIGIDEINNKVYVGSSSGGSFFPGGLWVIDGATNTSAQVSLSSIPLQSPASTLSVARDLAINRTTGKLYFRITGGSTTQLGVLNAGVASPLPNIGAVNTIRVNSTLNRIYVGATPSAGGDNQIHVFNGANDQEIATLTIGSPSTFITNQSYLAVDESNGRVYVADFNNDQLIVVNGQTNATMASIKMPFGPSTVAVNSTLNRIYIGSAHARTLTILDGATLRVVRTIALPIAPVTLAVDAAMSPARVYAESTASESAISVIDDPGGAAPSVISVTQGQNGSVVLNADGSVTYTPNAGFAGADTYTYTVAGGSTGTVNVTVLAPLEITTAALPNSTIAANYAAQLTATGGTGPISFTLLSGTLPSGLHLTVNGALSGTLRQSGTYTFTIRARDSGSPAQDDDATYTVVVGPPVVAPLTLASATVNTLYAQQMFASGATGNVTWSLNINNHPGLAWLSLSNDGVLSGVPTVYGTTPSFTITATDSLNQIASRSYTIFVNGPLDMTTMREGVVFETQPAVPIVGGSGIRTVTKTAGTLPEGLTLNSDGTFTGSPRRHGTYTFTLELRDCVSGSCGPSQQQQVVTRNITWRVSAKDQTAGSLPNPSIAFGGTPNGRKIAQVVTVGAQGLLTGFGSSSISCPATQTPVTIEVQRLTATGVPDGATIASGTATTNLSTIALSSPINVGIDDRLAFILSSPLSCNLTNPSANDNYNGGDAFVSNGGGWTPLLTTDSRYDVPSFRTLIQPAIDVAYMPSSHGGTTATLLNTGKVLVAGHSNGTTAELYDPATNSYATTGAMTVSRMHATATLLGNGKVLLVGGRDQNGNRLASAEIYDPATGTFTSTAGSLNFARDGHRAVRFVQGGIERVLITGGINSANATIASAELYDPASSTFTSIGNMLIGRQHHVAVMLGVNGNNKILLAGGYTSGAGPTAELFDPATNTFSATTGNMILSNRGWATGTLLPDGRVLIAGGQSGDVRNEAEVYDPVTNTFSGTGAMASKRHQHSATLLADGSVLISGGVDQSNVGSYVLPLATMERWVPGSNGFVSAGGMETRRASHASLTMPDGKAFIVGGFSQSYMTGNTSELYDPSTALTLTPTTLANADTGASYSVVFTPAGGSGNGYSISHVAGILPAGLSFAPPILSGTPTTTGDYAFTLRVVDGAGNSNQQPLTLRVGTPLTITSPYRLIDAAQNEAYNVPLTATGGNGVLVWSVVPALGNPLPPGMTLSSAGVLSGTPTTQNYYNFGVRVTDNNGAGVTAFKTLSISVQAPLTITTATINPPLLFNGVPTCLQASGGWGNRTWTITGGTLPPGVTLNTNGCFSGTAASFGTFNFTARVTDESSVPQDDSKGLSITVSALFDQGSSSDSNQPAISFGGAGGNLIAERVITGVTGMLSGVRLNGNNSICPSGTNVTAQVQGVALNGGPDGVVLATGTAVYPYIDYIAFTVPPFFTADQTFTIVFSADNTCAVRPVTFDSYPGEGYVYSVNWQRLHAIESRYDIPFQTVVTPSPGLGFMKSWRSQHQAITLNNGKILLLSDTTSELYDPATGAFTQSGSLTVQRYKPAASLLPDGRVLVTGGYNFTGLNGATVYLSSAEIYDPANGQFTATSALSTARAYHTATLLGDGRVLIAGGQNVINNIFTSLRSTEIYTPGSGFSAGPDMVGTRQQHTATRLDDGRVLIAGGSGPLSAGQTAELYTPGSPGSFAVTTNAPVLSFRVRHTATKLSNGLVLLAGGSGTAAGSSAELFNPADQTFTSVGPLTQSRVDHTATLLNDGSVLLSGGYDDGVCCGPYPPKAHLERYEYQIGFSNAGSMLVSRFLHAATLIPGADKVLFTGTAGWSSAGGRVSEIYDPATAVALNSVAAPQGQVGVAYPGMTLAAHGGTGPYSITFLSGALPGGLSYNGGTSSITGTPTQSGTFVSTFKVEDSAGHSSTQTITIRVDALTITTASLTPATINQQYSFTLAATGGSGGNTWGVYSGTIPQGLNFNQNGTITGTPTQTGFSFFTARVTDGSGQMALRSYGFSVLNPLTITTNSLGDGIAGQTYFGCVSSSNGAFPISWTVSGVPGLAFQNNSNCFDATYPLRVLRQGGAFTATVTATDSSSPTPQQVSKNLALLVHAQDQSMSGQNTAAVSLTSTRRVAQVVRVATPFPSSGVQLWNISSCTANTAITATLRPVTGTPERPDESGAPLAQATVTANGSGFFNSIAAWPATVMLPRGSLFAIVVSFANGSCSGTSWPVDDFYTYGHGWIDDNNAGWTRAATAVGREDIPLTSLVMPASDLLFTQTWRSAHVTATLADGRVLIAGTYDNTAEIYDPVTHTIAKTPGNMSTPRNGASATRLNNGKVLIVGGTFYNNQTSQTEFVATSELFDPSSGLFTAAASLPAGRTEHTATLLNNGKVLIAGGSGPNWQYSDVAVVYEADGLSAATITMTGARSQHSATKLADGRVLIAGGWGGTPFPASAEIYDPTQGTFTATANNMLEWDTSHTATLLTTGPNAGKVLIAGGLSNVFPNLATASQLYDPATDSFESGPALAVPRYNHEAIRLADGRVLLVGGSLSWNLWYPTAAVEIYDPANQDFEQVPDLVVDRVSPTVELLSSGPYAGQPLVIGGYGTGGLSGRTVEHYAVDTSAMVIQEQVLPEATLNASYAADFTVYGTTVGAVTFSLVSGTLPDGLTLNANGTITGTPTQASYHVFVVRAEDTASHVAYRASSIRVDPLRITTTTVPPAITNQNYSYQLEHSGGVGQVTWSVSSGTLPAGLTLSSSGVLSGTATAPASVWVSVRAIDETGYAVYQSLLVEVLDPAND